MRDLVKSIISFFWAMPLFGVKQIGDIFVPQDASQSQNNSITAFDAVTHTIEAQLENVTQRIFKVGDELQRGIVDAMYNAFPGVQSHPADSYMDPRARPSAQPPIPPPSASSSAPLRVDSGRLRRDTFIVLGEGLAAGMGNFTLSEETQKQSFPAHMAQQMQAKFSQPLLQAPGVGNLV